MPAVVVVYACCNRREWRARRAVKEEAGAGRQEATRKGEEKKVAEMGRAGAYWKRGPAVSLDWVCIRLAKNTQDRESLLCLKRTLLTAFA